MVCVQRSQQSRGLSGEETDEQLAFQAQQGNDAALCYNELKRSGIDCLLSPERMRYQRAVGVALAARARFLAGAVQTADELQPTYLRLPQAERDLKKRNWKKEA